MNHTNKPESNDTIIHVPLKTTILIAILAFSGPTAGSRIYDFLTSNPTRASAQVVTKAEHKEVLEAIKILDGKVDDLRTKVAHIEGSLWDGHIKESYSINK